MWFLFNAVENIQISSVEVIFEDCGTVSEERAFFGGFLYTDAAQHIEIFMFS